MVAAFLVLPLLSAAMSGCSCSDDPRTGGYICGQSGLNSGAYQQRVTTRQQTLENTQDDIKRKQQDSADLQMKNEDLTKQADQIEKDMNKLDADIAEMKKRIAAESASNSSHQKELAQLQKDAEQLRQQAAIAKNTPGTDAERQQELQRLQQRYNDIQNQILLITGGA
ncbi:hypothetical protein FRZ44_01100 [Hypericibacter terrae]|uniref:Lipoprotein n=1 Tax=Hypericibacter terrae TaxID=2602015 RepID=A0A5J6MEM6_9PROT|nr:hypothetical protein FRZ44_01100 [Hypericibacter terrae]